MNKKRHSKNTESYTLKSEYRDLTPINNIDNGDEYLNAMEWAIKNPNVKNIALSGPYGSGKSSIIETFLQKHKKANKKSVRISMASFEENNKSQSDDNNASIKINKAEENEQDIDNNTGAKDDEYDNEQEYLSYSHTNTNPIKASLIEQSILKQLFYKVDRSQIPQSRYKKLHKVDWKRILLILFIIVSIATILAYIFAPDKFYSVFSTVLSAGEKLNYNIVLSFFGAIGAIAVALIALAQLLAHFMPTLRINEIRFLNNMSAGFSGDNDESIFNKNIDEIMYFFEVTKYTYVFFEDLDRLDNSSVFITLRELNKLINSSDNIKRRIVFIYALKDDIFTDKDRTKFFDFIIPVVPIVNSTNSGEVLLDKIANSKKMGIEHNISQEYILDVSPFISDMRILHNIYNEFLVYKKNIVENQGLNLNDQPMMSLIIFKNLFPKEFADIQAETGIVKKAFNDALEFKKRQRNVLEHKIEELKENLKQADLEHLSNQKELKIVMLHNLIDGKGEADKIVIDNANTYSKEEILQDTFNMDVFQSFKRIEIYYYVRGNRTSMQCDKDTALKYYARWHKLKSMTIERKKNIQFEIEDKRHEIQTINSYNIKYLIAIYGHDEMLSDDVKHNKILVFMLRRGYIDEKYVNYINYFKPNSITTDDMNFILSIKHLHALPFDYALSKKEMIVKRLLVHEFEQKEIYNYDLLDYLLANSSNHESNEKLEIFIRQLSDNDDKSTDFIENYIDRTAYKDRFIKMLSKQWPDMWEYVYNNSSLTYERQIMFLTLLFTNASIDSIVEQNSEGSISAFIIEHKDILQKLSDVKIEKLTGIFDALNIVFADIIINDVSNDLIDYILDNSRYELNSLMIRTIVEYKDKTKLPELSQKNYTVIKEIGYNPLIEYIQKNLSIYIENVFIEKDNINEDIDSIVELVKYSIEDSNLACIIIEHEKFCAENISDFYIDWQNEDKPNLKIIWDALLEQDKVVASWNNIIDYWAEFKITHTLIEYICKHVEAINQTSSDDVTDEFVTNLIASEIDDETLKTVLSKVQRSIINLNLDNITTERLSLLINIHYFGFSSDFYTKIKSSHPSLRYEYIILNQDEYLEIIDEIPINETEFEMLLSKSTIRTDTAQKLLDEYTTQYITEDVVEAIVSKQLVIDKDIFDAAWEISDSDLKNKLMLNNLNLLDVDDFENCFSVLEEFYKDLSDRSRRHSVDLGYSLELEKLAEHLDKIGYTSNHFERDEGTIIRFQVRASKN